MDSQTITMIGITVFSDNIFCTKIFVKKHSAHGQVIESVSVTHFTQIDNKIGSTNRANHMTL